MVKGWIKTAIKNTAEIYSGGTPSTFNSAFWDDGIVWVTPSDITSQNSKYTCFSSRKISEAGLSATKLLPKGTILLCSRATIGELSIAGLPLATNQGFKNLVCFDNTDNEFLYYALQPLKQKMIEQSFGTTFLEISKTQLGEIEVLKPKDKKEQAEIAKALSAADAYIAALEKLIAKKKAVKIGAMQELLTGKRRLKGFTGEWKKQKVSDLSDMVICAISTGGDLNYLEIGDINIETKSYNISGKMKMSVNGAKRVPQGTLLISTVRPTRGAITLTKTEIFVSSAFCCLLPKNRLLYYAVCWQPFLDFLGENSIGGTYPTCKNNVILQYEFSFPTDTSEQTAIAHILSNMDAEIDALTAKLNKAKDVKIGMMQQLLTGQIRLVETAKDEQAEKFRDAVIYAGIVDIWGREKKYPLGRVKVMKLFYLYTRKVGGDINRFHEHAAGPYDETIRYGGGEPLAVEKGLIVVTDRGDASMFTCGTNIETAKKQIYDEGMTDAFKWLSDNFRMATVDELELLATVDLARVKIEAAGKTADAQSILTYISNSEEWIPKLTKEEFHISNIAAALKQSREIFI
jgi:type I restriction enzyme S subunit